MKKRVLLALIAINLIASVSLFSADMSGRIGIGYDTSVNCASVRFFIGNFGIDVLAGFTFEPANINIGDQTALLTFRGAGYFIYPIELLEKANLNIFAGAEVENVGSHTANQSVLNYYIRAGLSPEIFLLDNLSVEANFGLECAFVTSVVPNEYRVTVDLYGNSISIVSGLSFHWYLGKGK